MLRSKLFHAAVSRSVAAAAAIAAPVASAARNVIIVFGIISATSHAQYFTNPILTGFYPDPSICRAGDDYYIVNSSFAYYPGLPVFHSKDLLHWKQIGYALDRPEQLNLDSAGVSRGLFAPAISYHNGTFYIVCTLIDKLGNFVITAKDPAGPWSNPQPLPEVNGIDPALFFEDEGRAYILYNSIPPNNISLHDGHRTIRMYEFDPIQLKVLGSEYLLVNGGTDMSKKPVWIEGPHIIKKDGWYYLFCAEGGTGYNHSEVVFRSKIITGPYEPFQNNPILTQRHLDPKRKYPVTTTGHADFVQAKDGNWWAVFLGCRPYENDHYNTGRETFMAPVTWKDGWPMIIPGFETVKYKYPIKITRNEKEIAFSGNFTFRDNFDSSLLNKRYSFLRTLRNQWYSIQQGELRMRLRPETCSGSLNPSFIGFRQPHLKGNASTAISFNPENQSESAGLIVFQNERHYYYLCKTKMENKIIVQLLKGPGTNNSNASQIIVAQEVLNESPELLHLKIAADNSQYIFSYTIGKEKWKVLATADATFLSTKTAGGFVGCLYAMYATSNGKPSDNVAAYSYFSCESTDKVFQ